MSTNTSMNKDNQLKNRIDMDFPIVGIGASAGGLEALQLFVSQIPLDSGLAFVIVQHQDPTHKGIMVELLQHHTSLPVYQIEDQMPVVPNHIYCIPPGFDLSINQNRVHLLKPNAPRGLRLPIDFFFSSLSEAKQHNCIGVILSGMGSDGTLGIRAIKEKGGAVFAQEPHTAKFDAMPLSAIHTKLVDVIAPAQELPLQILNYLKGSRSSPTEEIELEVSKQSAIKKIVSLIRAQTGNDFSPYKKNTLYRRIERRIGLHQLFTLSEYVDYLNEHPQEVKLLSRELLIGVTHFFRDPIVWEELKTQIMPSLFRSYPNGSVFRAWVAGCSTGEEAYSLAIAFKEALEELLPPNKNFSLQIFATDLDSDTIAVARTGIFSHNIAEHVSEARLRRFFIEENNAYKINKEIREMVIFAAQNVITDPPFTKLNILSCRNLFIYFDSELQKKLLHLFHYSLNSNGVLMLGSAETVGSESFLFASFSGKNQLFRRLENSNVLKHTEFPTSIPHHISKLSEPTPQVKTPNLKILVESLLLGFYSPSAVLVTTQGDILYINGKTGKYLEPASGKANLNLFAMAREGLKQALSETFQKTLRQQSPVSLNKIKIKNHDKMYIVDVTIHPVIDREELTGMLLVIFNDVNIAKENKTIKSKPGKVDSDRVASLIEELQYSQETLQITREEMQNSQEELKSTNEELQSTNEELQSTNEELTTSKEEMQSMNEELQIVNNELQIKIDELSHTSNDMHNLLNSTDIAILFLDGELKFRRFTNQVTNIIKLIPTDIGRKVTDLVSELDYPNLAVDAKEVLSTLVFKENQIPTHDDRWFIVKIMPYRTLENRIDGVVITFTDITISKKLELELQKTKLDLQALLNIQTQEKIQALNLRTDKPSSETS